MDGVQGLRLTVLGELAATRGGVPLDLGGRRQRAVLAVLVVARGDVVPAERLIDAVWGEDAPANPAGALQSYVSHLRKRLEPQAGARERGGVLVREGNGYAVRLPADDVDAWRVEQLLHAAAAAPPREAADLLAEAVAQWRGPAYAEYADETWAEAEVVRLAELRAVARERLLAARLELGQAALAVAELEALVAEDPLREERWRLLVLALYRAQRQADALAALRRARDVLADQLGCDPGPALRALEAEVLAQSPALEVPVQRSAPAPAASDLVDRDRELTAVARALDAAQRGEPGLLLVEGPAGIGKTRLLTEVHGAAGTRGFTVLTARASQLERAFGFGVVHQLLEPVLADDARRERLLTGAAGSARPLFAQVDGEQRADGSFAVLHGLYWLTVNLAATGPVLLAVDDVQWSDGPSLRFLAYLLKRLEDLPVLLVATLRTGEEHEDEELLAELALDPSTVPLRPGPLGLEATRALVAERLGTPAEAFVTACHRTTSGNPLLLRQLLRALESEQVPPDAMSVDTVRAVGSRAVRSLVLLRLRRMPPEAVEVARAVAVLGAAANLPGVAALAGLPEAETAAVLAALSRSEVLRDQQPPAFVHPLVGDAVYGDLPAAERALRHERAARVVRGTGAGDDKVAAHLLLAPCRGDAATVAVLRAAARAAVDRGAAETAVTLLRRALDEPAVGSTRVALLVELGLIETRVDGRAAVAHLQEAWPFVDDVARRGEVAMVIARTHVFASDRGVATAFAREARASLPSDQVDARQGLLALQRITGIMHGLDPSTYRLDGPDDVVGTGHGARMLAAALGYELMLAGQERERVVALGRFALDGDVLLAVDNGLMWVVAGMTLVLADEDVGDFWERAGRHAHAHGSLFHALSVNLWRGHHEMSRGDLRDAVQSLRDASEQARMWGSAGVGQLYAGAFLAQALLARGDVAGARTVLDEALRVPALGEGLRLLLEADARVLRAEGRPEQALAQLERCADPYGIENPVWAPWRRLRAVALHDLGRTDEATGLLEEEVRRLREWGAPSGLGRALRVLGEVTEDVTVLREAEQVLSTSRAVLQRARARYALGRRLGGGEALDLLAQAHAAAARCGADSLRRDVEAELVRRGAPVPAEPEAVPLTRTQHRALELLGDGLGLHEVAQQLFLTPGSVRATLQTVQAAP